MAVTAFAIASTALIPHQSGARAFGYYIGYIGYIAVRWLLYYFNQARVFTLIKLKFDPVDSDTLHKAIFEGIVFLTYSAFAIRTQTTTCVGKSKENAA